VELPKIRQIVPQMGEPKNKFQDKEEELPSAVDDAASVILESKRNEAFVRKNALEEKKSSVRGQAVFVQLVLCWLHSVRFLYLIFDCRK